MVLPIGPRINYYQLMRKRALRPTGEAPPYVVVRYYQDPEAAAGHDHVTAIETRDPDGGTTRWRSIDVIAAIRGGERFVVEDDGHGRESILEPSLCLVCPRVTVKPVAP
jgi:hypothetical protein